MLLLLEGLYLLWRTHRGPEARRLARRLRTLSASRDGTLQTQLLRQRMLSELPVLERALQRLPRMHRLDRMILQSGLTWTVSNLLLAVMVASMAGLAATMIASHQPLVVGLAAAVAAGSLPLLYVRQRRGKRLARIEAQLPEVLDLLTRALRAGHALNAALKMAGEEMAEPVSSEFRAVHDEVAFGVSLQQALTHLSDRVPLTELRYFVVAVLIQRDSGGNLTEILRNLSNLMRERAKLAGKVRVLSADGRMSAWVLALMPFALAALMYLANPTFMSRLWTDPIGISIIQTLLFMMALGMLVLRQIIRIRV
jgi:tight adherence protein B